MSVYLLIAYLFLKTPLFQPLANLSSWPIHKLMVYAIFIRLLHYAYWQRRGQTERIFNPWQAMLLGVIAEGSQMLILLAVARPFDQAVALVEAIALPMMLANALGAALFMSFIRDAKFQADELASRISKRALRIARRCVGLLDDGFNARSAQAIAEVVKDETGVAAVAITGRVQILAFSGMGADHHPVGRSISSASTLEAIRDNKVVFADGLTMPYQCSIAADCELGSSLVVPLKGEQDVIGTIKLYEPKRKLFRSLNRSLGEGIAGVLSNQILHSQLQASRALLAQAELRSRIKRATIKGVTH